MSWRIVAVDGGVCSTCYCIDVFLELLSCGVQTAVARRWLTNAGRIEQSACSTSRAPGVGEATPGDVPWEAAGRRGGIISSFASRVLARGGSCERFDGVVFRSRSVFFFVE